MKEIGGLIIGVFFASGLMCLPYPLRAQEGASGNANANLGSNLQAIEQVPPMPPASGPKFGTFYSAAHPDRPPMPGNINQVPIWSLGDGFFVLDDLVQSQTQSAMGMHAMDDSGPLGPGGDGGDSSSPIGPITGAGGEGINTNGLWLQITNVANSLAYLNLMNATNYVYEIITEHALTAPGNWSIAGEVFPGINTNVMPFTVGASSPTNLFIWAMDWTGVTGNGNQTPDWWFWQNFGTINLSDTNVDSFGNTLLSDYQYGFDPNIIQFSTCITNQYVTSAGVPIQLNITAGAPSYMAILVDDTNYSDATWNAYTSSNININLGAIQGWHNVYVGLRGLPSNATQTWHSEHLNLALPPVLVITNPATFSVDEPLIQIYGYCQEPLASISYDISNAVGVAINQPSEITDQVYDTNACGYTLNYFECLDVPLTNGLNTITIHATDLAGDTIITNFNFTLDYSGKTNPPLVQITWPQNDTQVSGTNFTLTGQVGDPTVTVSATITDTNGDTNVVSGYVERNGILWVDGISLNAGTNILTLTITDVVGNTSVTNINVVQSPLNLTINPVSPNSQLWQSTVNLTGTISDPTYAVWANGVKGTNNGNGTWAASNVPVNDGGTAGFTATAYAPTEQQPDGSYGN